MVLESIFRRKVPIIVLWEILFTPINLIIFPYSAIFYYIELLIFKRYLKLWKKQLKPRLLKTAIGG